MTTNFIEKRSLRFRIIFSSSQNVQIFFSLIFSYVSRFDVTSNVLVEGKGRQEDDNATEQLNMSGHETMQIVSLCR